MRMQLKAAFSMVSKILIALFSISAIGYGREGGENSALLGSGANLNNLLLNGHQGVKCCQPSCCCIQPAQCTCCQPVSPITPVSPPQPCCCCCCNLPTPPTTTLPPPPPPVQTERIMCCQSPPIVIQPPPFYYKQVITCNTENVPIEAPCQGKCNGGSECGCCCDCNKGMQSHLEMGVPGGTSVLYNPHVPSFTDMTGSDLNNMFHQNAAGGHGGLANSGNMVNQNILDRNNPIVGPGNMINHNDMSWHNPISPIGPSGPGGMTGHMANPVVKPMDMIGHEYMSNILQPVHDPNNMNGLVQDNSNFGSLMVSGASGHGNMGAGYQHGVNGINRLTGFRSMKKVKTNDNSRNTFRMFIDNGEGFKLSQNNRTYQELKKMPALIVEYNK